MLVPFRLNSLPGLLLAALPPVAVAGFTFALLSYVGGSAQVWRMVGASGPYSLLMMVGVLGVTFVLSALLGMGPAGKHAPLVVLVGLATLPWMLGIAGSQEAMERMLPALPEGRHGEALAPWVAGTGEAMVTRLVGAWMSAALLGAVALGLVLLHKRASSGGEQAGRLLGAALGMALGGTALVVALEAHQLFELLTSLAARTPEVRAELIAQSTGTLAHLQELRAALMGLLAILALALVCWQFFLRPEAVSQWAGSLMLGALVAAVVVLDARPMQLAAQEASLAESPGTSLPLMVRGMLSDALGAVPPTGHLPAPALSTKP
ncbi:hypothetical protein [Melittangium boletus]|uniref:Uncharacterized protein n=1 Tax=Melittangium boletus DSM 14713 TaxID=1294270 RepID=A0A250IHL0_9BACT|nr:hypothetical protein [Melittangium boletus]ATB30710.1 hypothetical protein MEBOL_004171 [Melittangium boletus DSM 14713]